MGALTFFTTKAGIPVRHIWYATQNLAYKKLQFPPSTLSPISFSLSFRCVTWSYTDIFDILMQNKQSQITHILPPYWFVEVVNPIKLPFLSVDLSWLEPLTEIASSTEPLLWSAFFFFLQGVCEKEQDFLSLGSGPPIASTSPVWLSLSRSALVNSHVLHTLFITRSAETIILFWKCSRFAWNTSHQLFWSAQFHVFMKHSRRLYDIQHLREVQSLVSSHRFS